MAAFRDILSTVARKKPFYSRTSWSRDLSDFFFFFSFYEDEKSPSHRISQVDICACIHHLPPRAKSNRDFPFLLHREFIPIDFSSSCAIYSNNSRSKNLYFERNRTYPSKEEFLNVHTNVSGKIYIVKFDEIVILNIYVFFVNFNLQ